MNDDHRPRVRAFSLIEMLVVMSIIALLTTIIMPALAKARLQAKILTVNADLRQISLALELYFEANKKYPPTMADCGSGSLQEHMAQLPKRLADGGYLPAMNKRDAMDTVMEDPFNPGHTYKYSACGEVVLDRDKIDRTIKAALWVPDGFPGQSSLEETAGQWYDDSRTSPVVWVIYSLGPNFDADRFAERARKRFYPVPKEIWYNPDRKEGLLVRLRLQNGREIGSFEGF